MNDRTPATGGKNGTRRVWALRGLVALFVVLTVTFVLDLWSRPPSLYPIPLVDPALIETTSVRRSYADLIAAEEDLSDFDCYACHDKNEPPPLRFDADRNLIIPAEHGNIVMGHGRHNRNNLCFNCHDEANLSMLQTRDGHELNMAESTPLCGSCHGPTYRDWEAGVHGKTTGFWDRSFGPIKRLNCVNCHNPHSPAFPSRSPAPGPHPLHGPAEPAHKTEER